MNLTFKHKLHLRAKYIVITTKLLMTNSLKRDMRKYQYILEFLDVLDVKFDGSQTK